MAAASPRAASSNPNPASMSATRPGWLSLAVRHVMAPAVDHRRGHVPRAERGTPGQNRAAHRDDPEQRQGGLVLVRLGVHPDLAEHRRGVRGVRGHPVRARHVPVPAPAQALAVQGHMRAGVRGQAARDPPAQGRLQLLRVDPPQGLGQGRRGRRRAPPEPQRVSQRGPVLAPEPGDPLKPGAAHQHRHRDQPEDRRQRVDPALQPARVGDRRLLLILPARGHRAPRVE